MIKRFRLFDPEPLLWLVEQTLRPLPPKVLNVFLVKSEEVKSKNPPHFRVKDFCVYSTKKIGAF